MNVAKSILKRLGIILGSVTILPIAAVILVALIGIFTPLLVLAAIWAAFAMSPDELDDCFTVEKVDDDLVID